MKKTLNTLLALVLVLSLIGCASTAETKTGKSPNPAYESLVTALSWQLSAESNALMEQAFNTASRIVDEMVEKCSDPDNPEWTIETGDDGKPRMMHNGIRVAVVSDIDDTLVDGAHYTADIVGNDGDYNNAAFARFLLSDGCTALPGAVEFMNKCVGNGIEVYYVTNRYDQGYKVGQSDSQGSYEESIEKDGKGLYISPDGSEIGSTVYQVLGRSIYDISLESMKKLGFPVDDQHLIVNDMKLNGSSKEPARWAIRNGDAAYPNGQRNDGNVTGSALTAAIEPHEIVMLLGDTTGDFTDAFSLKSLDAVERTNLVTEYADYWGREWIVLPNSVYGGSITYASAYGEEALFKYYSYVK